jgi:4a-hydroxytetrahydrobiopterin dehydratase
MLADVSAIIGSLDIVFGEIDRWAYARYRLDNWLEDKDMTETLAEKTCTACRGGIPPLTRDQAQRLQAQAPNWELADDAHRIERRFRFRNFRESLAFVQEVGELAESEGHHPDISFGWGYTTVSLTTKKIKGLHENDFIMASKIDRMLDRSGRPLDRQEWHGKSIANQARSSMPHIRTDNQPVTQITVIEAEPGKQAEALSLMIERARVMARQPGFISISLHRSVDGRRIVNYIQWQSRDLLQSAHKSPEFRKEWGQFDQLTDEIDPHLYEVAHVMDSSQ